MRTHSWRQDRNFWCLVGALFLLLLACTQPKVMMEQEVRSFLFIVDITQSMNVDDMALHGVPTSRLAYARKMLQEATKALPCGSQVGLGIFAKANAVLLYAPIEVCSNFDVLQESISHLDWRMASHGSSHLRFGLQSMATLVKTQTNPTQVVFFTDGEEAPPLNELTRISLSDWQGGKDWILVGLGGNTPKPIPKLNTRDEVMGYWSLYSIKIEPTAIVSEESTGKRDDSLATDPNEYYLSRLDEPYLKSLAEEIGGRYWRAQTPEKFARELSRTETALNYRTPVNLARWLGLLAFILVLYGSVKLTYSRN
jgi:mxaL protein